MEFIAIILANIMFMGLVAFAITLDRRVAALERLQHFTGTMETAEGSGQLDFNSALTSLMSYGATLGGEGNDE